MALIEYDDIVLLKSIEAPRAVSIAKELERLLELAHQGLVSFGATMREMDTSDAPVFYPTAKLTRHGRSLLAVAFLRTKKPLRKKIEKKMAVSFA